jgi:pescadillo
VIRTHALRKVFVSIKGIYYQCELMGQTVTYIVPFKYPASLPLDVDYRVMATFLDFYLVLLKFVNYKLYSEAHLEYPPLEQDATSYQGYQLRPIVNNDNEDERYQIDEEFQGKQTDDKNLLFANLKFYLSTEVPRYSLEYVILAFGGAVTLDSNDSSVTHVITDRDGVSREKTKEYVQPQWVYDSLNFSKLLNVKEYQVGKVTPSLCSPSRPTSLHSSTSKTPTATFLNARSSSADCPLKPLRLRWRSRRQRSTTSSPKSVRRWRLASRRRRTSLKSPRTS